MGIPMMRAVTMFDDPSRTTWKQRLKQYYHPIPYRFLDCVVVGSDAMRCNLRGLGVDTRIEIIPHGVNLRHFRPAAAPPCAADLRARLGLRPESEVVLFVGPIEKRKGLDNLIAAWGGVATSRPRAHLLLVGPERTGSNQTEADTFADRLRSTLYQAPGADRITFVGRVPDVSEYFQAADIFVFPSRQEGMPNAVCEAFASGLACVLTPFLGLPREFGQPGQQYVLTNHDGASLAESIVALLTDGAARQKLGRAARRWAETHLDVERALDRYAELCRELVGAPIRVRRIT
jgi:glycosyltransferase involved in cell wall biosynthesis